MLVKENLYDFKHFKEGGYQSNKNTAFVKVENNIVKAKDITDYFGDFLVPGPPVIDPNKNYIAGFKGTFAGNEIRFYCGKEFRLLTVKDNLMYRELTEEEKSLNKLGDWHIKFDGEVAIIEPFLIEGTLADITLPNNLKIAEENKLFYKEGNYKEIQSI